MKKILTTYNEANYSLSDYTFGFELEGFTDTYDYRDELDTDFIERFIEFERKFPDFIDMSKSDMDDDCSIEPNETCEYCGGEGTTYCPECDGDREVECPDCEGRGMIDCETCNGTGEVIEACEHCKGTGKDPEGQLNIFGEIQECPECEGQGTERTVTCPDCDGDREVECPRCDGYGRVDCNYCGGEGRVDCPECEGCSNSYMTYEWASPVFKFSTVSVQKVINFLKEGVRIGAINTNESCGFHIHLGFPKAERRSNDIFWFLCQLALDEDFFDSIRDFKGISLENYSMASSRHIRQLNKELIWVGEKYKDIMELYKFKAKEIKDDMGAFDLDVEGNMYKGYKEDFYAEAKIKVNKDVSYYYLSDLFFDRILNQFYDNSKFVLFRQHPQGTLEWRGSRGFMDAGRISDISDFFTKVFYPLVKWINDSLNKSELDLGNGVKISKNVFDEMLKMKKPPAPNLSVKKVDVRFSKDMKRELIGETIKLFPKNTKFQNLNMIKKNGNFIVDYSNEIELNNDNFPSQVKRIANSIIRKAIIGENDAHFQRVNIIDCQIEKNNEFQHCNLRNVKIDGSEYFSSRVGNSLINDGIFDECTVFNSDINKGNFSLTEVDECKIFDCEEMRECRIYDSDIRNGNFVDCRLSETDVINGKFKRCTWIHDRKRSWYGGDWIVGDYFNPITGERYENIEEPPNIFVPLMFRYMAAKKNKISLDRIPQMPKNVNYQDFIVQLKEKYNI